MSPYAQVPDGPLLGEFTAVMRERLLALKARIEQEKDIPSFPWEEYHYLAEKEMLSRLSSNRLVIEDASTRLHQLLAKEQKLFIAINSLLVTRNSKVNASVRAGMLNHLRKQKNALATAFKVHDSLVELTKTGDFIAPGFHVNEDLLPFPKSLLQKSATHVKQKIAAPTLESLCKDAATAQKIDRVWEHVKSNTLRINEHTAACAAVYKLVEHLGKVRPGTPATEWKAMLHHRYGVAISEGIGKYRLDKANSKVFRKAVISAYGFIKQNYLGWTAGKHLPDIYH